ncbi:hypothetical protein NNC19_07190 [Clostridium sp. SHJSY1]|uniref:hypothetical protein n=1 Tax=Clostridium sp. SHJSY1 TaxID=2942483 RepID=UPI0028757381|nr:hypothetical protein [Clostridium sp. SHJSY1]MDS0525458.1 hypothetical protein [Clostridium sp. SHJSY1]
MSTNINMVIGNATLFYGDNYFNATNVDELIKSLTDDKKLGLGKDSIKFTAKPKITDFDFAGKEDRKVKNMEEITGWDIKAEGSLLDLNENVLSASLIKKDTKTSSETYEVFIPQPSLNNSSYHDLVILGRVKNNQYPIAIIVKNSYNAEGFSMEFKDKENDAIKMSFEGAYDMDKLDETPFKIIKPKAVAVVDDTK